MVTSLLLALIGHGHLLAGAPVNGNMDWEEYPDVQKIRTYHPMLRFNPSATFMIVTPDYTAEGKYAVNGNHYDFHPTMAIQLENADVDKLVNNLDNATRIKLHQAYARSLSNFDADYDESTGVLHLNYVVEGAMKTFSLHPYTEGDNQLLSAVSSEERGYVGLWSQPEPFPEKLDARTRYKIGDLEGLERFSSEAKASDAAQFNLLDLRVDKSYRIHGTVGTWYRSGSTLRLIYEAKETVLHISEDTRKLILNGKVVYTRG